MHLLFFVGIQGWMHCLQEGLHCHTSKHIKAFLALEFPRDQPGNRPDLNPVDSCGNHMKILLKKDISSIPKQVKPIKELWTQELTIDHLQKPGDSYAQEATDG
jgi:hypothetical protein